MAMTFASLRILYSVSGGGLTWLGIAKSPLSFRSENAIPRIAYSRQDITVFVQFAIDGGGIDRNVRMRFLQCSQPLRRRNETQKLDVRGILILHPVDGGDGGMPGR